MGTLFTLTPQILSITQTALDDLIEELGKDCKLIYQPTQVECSDCVNGGAWVHGSYMPKDGNYCPFCDNTGYRNEVTTETITMLVAMKPSEFYIPFPANVQIPIGTIQTKTYLSNLKKIKQAKEMILQPSITVARWRYTLSGDPVDISNLVQGQYIVCTWNRNGG